VMLRLIDGCDLRLSERLLGTTADKRKLLKSKKSMEVFEVESCVQGHHIYKHVWTSFIGEELTCTHEIENTKDPFAVAMVCCFTVVAMSLEKYQPHVPCS